MRKKSMIGPTSSVLCPFTAIQNTTAQIEIIITFAPSFIRFNFPFVLPMLTDSSATSIHATPRPTVLWTRQTIVKGRRIKP